MQQDNKIQKKLQQLENQQLPDLSQMDKHWEQMQGILQPVESIPAKKHFIPGVGIAACAAVLIGLVAIIYFDRIKEHIPETAIVKIHNQTKHTVISDTTKSVFTDSVKVKMIPSNYPLNTTISLGETFNKSVSFIHDSLEEILHQQHVEPAFKIDERLLKLKKLLIDFLKESENFYINNQRDTLLACKEGTAVFIPAQTFAYAGNVNIRITEYYSNSDIVLNRLTTMSGNSQLISGGMLNVTAWVNNKEITMDKGKKLKIFIPGISFKDSFQIFKGEESKDFESDKLSSVNWNLTKIRIDSPVQQMFIRALDLRDDNAEIPYISSSGKSVVIIPRSPESSLTKDELKKIMKKKYPYYDKIRIRKLWKRNLLFKDAESFSIEYGSITNSYGIGDTAELLPSTIRIYKLTPIDTVYHVVNRINMGTIVRNEAMLSASMRKIIGEKSSIQTDQLGWINCDRFYNYPGSKTDFFVNLGDSAKNYYTVLLFNKFKSMINGNMTNDTRVYFPNLPVGEPVTVISIGINKENNTVMAMKETVIGSAVLNNLIYEKHEINGIKKALGVLNK